MSSQRLLTVHLSPQPHFPLASFAQVHCEACRDCVSG